MRAGGRGGKDANTEDEPVHGPRAPDHVVLDLLQRARLPVGQGEAKGGLHVRDGRKGGGGGGGRGGGGGGGVIGEAGGASGRLPFGVEGDNLSSGLLRADQGFLLKGGEGGRERGGEEERGKGG